jgi:hypothetical protein
MQFQTPYGSPFLIRNLSLYRNIDNETGIAGIQRNWGHALKVSGGSREIREGERKSLYPRFVDQITGTMLALIFQRQFDPSRVPICKGFRGVTVAPGKNDGTMSFHQSIGLSPNSFQRMDRDEDSANSCNEQS